jgi:TonB family protein
MRNPRDLCLKFRLSLLRFLAGFVLTALSVDSAFCVAPAGAPTSSLTNLSVRSTAGSGSATLIVGFNIFGTGSKSVLLRGIGPSLAQFGVPGLVANPALQLYSGSTQIAQNDDWAGTAALVAAFATAGAFSLTPASLDAAMLETLQAGPFTAQLIAKSGPGVALIECYDMSPGDPAAYFSNVSARSVAGTGANVLIVGFAISGTGPTTLLLRGIGPTLSNFGVAGVLPAARLRLFNSTGTEIANNDQWVDAVTPESVFDSVGAFKLPNGSSDAVLLLGLPPGTYTAQVSGINNVTGTALVEAYSVADSPVPFITLEPVTNPADGPPTDPGDGTSSPGPDAVAAVVTQPSPIYPIALREASITGTAMVDFYVLSDGTVRNAVAVQATDVRLGDASTTAVLTWTFTPGRKNNQLVTTHFQVPIVFSLGD